jgi:hypothetical protein
MYPPVQLLYANKILKKNFGGTDTDIQNILGKKTLEKNSKLHVSIHSFA